VDSTANDGTEITVKQHKDLKGLKTQNLRDHMGEPELIFTALAELPTRQIAESSEMLLVWLKTRLPCLCCYIS
jgi:hypothetical protein